MCAQKCRHSVKKVLSLDVEESEDAGSFERNCQMCFTGHLLNMRLNNLDTLTKETKTVKKFSRKENYNHLWTLCLYICYPLNPFVIFYAISIF